MDESAAITFVGAKALYRRISFSCNNRRPQAHCRVDQIRSMNDHAQKTAQGICCYLPFSSFVFFPVETAPVTGISCLDTPGINDGIGRILFLTGIFSRHFDQVFKDLIPFTARIYQI